MRERKKSFDSGFFWGVIFMIAIAAVSIAGYKFLIEEKKEEIDPTLLPGYQETMEIYEWGKNQKKKEN